MNFSSLGLSESIVRAASSLGWVSPTAVQQQAIAAIVTGGDLWASSQTGSGKTGAYVLPLLEILELSPPEVSGSIPALILVPTRELAAQVADLVSAIQPHVTRTIKLCVAVGGISINPQMMDLRGGADIVVATPGRLLDLVDNNALDLSSVQMLVLDEADRLLSAGFSDELARVLELLPVERQNLLFSATMPPRVRALADQLLRDPVCVNVDVGQIVQADAVEQRAIRVDTKERTRLLRHLLVEQGWPQVLVFVESRRRAHNLSEKLSASGIQSAALHGDLGQSARQEALWELKEQRIQVLVATDVAARGLDIPNLPAVLNYDLPRSTTDYLHRIGRTGRAGHRGVAISFVTALNLAHFCLIAKRHELTVELEELVGFEPTEVVVPPLDPHGGVKGKRKSKKDKLREAAALAAVDSKGER